MTGAVAVVAAAGQSLWAPWSSVGLREMDSALRRNMGRTMDPSCYTYRMILGCFAIFTALLTSITVNVYIVNVGNKLVTNQ